MNSNFILLAFFFALHSLSEAVDYKFLKSECETSEKKTIIVSRCDVDGKKFSVTAKIQRPLGLTRQLNVWINLKTCKKSLNLFLKVLLGFNKYENQTFRQIFKVKKVEWCSLVNGTARSNYMTTMIINTVKTSATETLFHNCPFSGSIVLSNVILKADAMFSIYPSGVYQLFFKIYDDVDPQILLVNLTYDLKNWNKI